MKEKNRKSMNFCALFFLFIVSISTFSSSVIANINFGSAKKDVIVLYDPYNPTIIKSKSLFCGLIEYEELTITTHAISSEEVYEAVLDNLNMNYDAIVIIGHGSWIGIQFGEDIILWENIRMDLCTISAQNKVLLSCYSEIVSLGLSKNEQESYIGFETNIDYILACYSGSYELASLLGCDELVNKISEKAENFKDTLLKRAATNPEPLWTQHNKMASMAKGFLGRSWSGKKNMPSNAIDAGDADIADKLVVNGAVVNPVVLILDPGRYSLWLKHNYGNRGGLEIFAQFFLLKIHLFYLPNSYGTAHIAAQDCYNKAINYYKNGNYAQAGTQLSYAIHYGQDMTMPYHVYDYGGIYIPVLPELMSLIMMSLLITSLVAINSAMSIDQHNIMENWEANNWNNLEISSYSDINSFSFKSGTNAVRDTVSNLAQWTRNNYPRASCDWFMHLTQQQKKAKVYPLLAKAVDFSYCLYMKFIKEA